MNKLEYRQDDLLESYFVHWYNTIAQVNFDCGIPEADILKFIKDKKSIPINDLAMLHSKYRLWELEYSEMDIEFSREILFTYTNRMNRKQEMKGVELIQRFILESMSAGIAYKYKNTLKWYEKEDGYLIQIIIAILGLLFLAIVLF